MALFQGLLTGSRGVILLTPKACQLVPFNQLLQNTFEWFSLPYPSQPHYREVISSISNSQGWDSFLSIFNIQSVHSQSPQSCPTLCDPVDCGLPSSSVRGLSWQEYWSGLPFSSPGDLPDPEIEPVSPASPALAGKFFTTEPCGKPTEYNKGGLN